MDVERITSLTEFPRLEAWLAETRGNRSVRIERAEMLARGASQASWARDVGDGDGVRACVLHRDVPGKIASCHSRTEECVVARAACEAGVRRSALGGHGPALGRELDRKLARIRTITSGLGLLETLGLPSADPSLSAVARLRRCPAPVSDLDGICAESRPPRLKYSRNGRAGGLGRARVRRGGRPPAAQSRGHQGGARDNGRDVNMRSKAAVPLSAHLAEPCAITAEAQRIWLEGDAG